ncbi:MAG: thioredoxin fold domain-containing protein [Gammaproteobacteria bacterium]|nr:thioredoxin fold domain-containing protein [Gammaproteobacteria bacterium]
MQKLFRTILILSLISFSSALMADEKADLQRVKQLIQTNIPNIDIASIEKSKMPGVYEILSSGSILYVSEDGNYLISGKLFAIDKGIKDLTSESMQRFDAINIPIRRDTISGVSEDDMIVFKADNEKHRVTVFTDVDCGYCRKLHKEMDQYNELGITVQYMGFPRAGLGSGSHKKLQTVWCAADPNTAMDKAKIDREFGTDTCEDPLAEHYKIVKEFGLDGTPAIILESGQLVSGFVEADGLLGIIVADEKALANTDTKTESE